MKLNKKIIQAIKSAEVILLIVLFFTFILIQTVYPAWSFAQALVMAVVVIAIRIIFKVSESKDNTQIIENKE